MYCSAVYLSANPLKPQDRKGSFMTLPAGKVPGYKNVIKKGLVFITTSMLAQYQQGRHVLFEWWGKPHYSEENHHKLVWYRQNGVDITRQRCKAIGLPVGMGIPNRQAAQWRGPTRTNQRVHRIIHCLSIS